MDSATMRASAFESYMLTDDTPDQPMTFLFRFRFSGELDPLVFRQSIDVVSPQHPLLTSRPERRGNQWWWVRRTLPLSLDDGPLEKSLQGGDRAPIDLQRDPGIRLWCRRGDGRTEITMQGHHACTDGLGALQFFFDVLAQYHLRVNDAGSTRPLNGDRDRTWGRRIDPDLLAGRDCQEFLPPEPVSPSKQLRFLVGETSKLLLRQPARLRSSPSLSPSLSSPSLSSSPPAASCEDPPWDSERPGLTGLLLPESTSRAYRQAAQAQSVMVNDLLLRDMFLTLVSWARRNGRPLPPRGWLRLTMPINVRTRAQARMSAANAISYAFITRRVDSTEDPPSLLAGIHEETEAIKHWKLAGMFLAGVTAMRRARLLGSVLRVPTCFSSLVLSNLGDVRHCATAKFPRREGRLVAGNLELESVVAAPPPRARTHGAVVVARYADRYSLGLQTDDSIDASAAAQFLQMYAQQIARTAGERNPKSEPRRAGEQALEVAVGDPC